MPRILYDGELLADYHQFYLHDEAHPELPDGYTAEVLAQRLMAGAHGAVMLTARNVTVPVRVEWHDQPPVPDLRAWQHVVDAGFSSPSGRLVLAGLTDYAPDAPRLGVPAGSLGIRFCLTGLDTLSDDGIDGDDRYIVQLWPHAGTDAVRVLKAWVEE